ncbi:MAG: hypothetical protein ABI476_07035 [Oxalobacteraceae bacterium]
MHDGWRIKQMLIGQTIDLHPTRGESIGMAADAQQARAVVAHLVLQRKTPDALHRAFIGKVKKQEN